MDLGQPATQTLGSHSGRQIGMAEKDPARCSQAVGGGVIAGGFAGAAAGAGIGTAVGIGPGVFIGALAGGVLGAIGGALTANGTADACLRDGAGGKKQNEQSVVRGLALLGIVLGAFLGLQLLKVLAVNVTPALAAGIVISGGLGGFAGYLLAYGTRPAPVVQRARATRR